MTTVKAILTKPLDGDPEGTEREFDKHDFDRLEALGAVRKAGAEGQKAAPPVLNKMDTPPANKDVVASTTRQNKKA